MPISKNIARNYLHAGLDLCDRRSFWDNRLVWRPYVPQLPSGIEASCSCRTFCDASGARVSSSSLSPRSSLIITRFFTTGSFHPCSPHPTCHGRHYVSESFVQDGILLYKCGLLLTTPLDQDFLFCRDLLSLLVVHLLPRGILMG
jgi:hypothetical protein